MFHNILIVDDEAHVTESMLALFKSQGDLDCEFFAANSAEEALTLAEKERIDLIISDINMPDVNGIELLRTMRQKWPRCEVILLTGFSNFNNVYDAFQLNAAGFLLKTESDEQIVGKVQEVLRRIDERLNQSQLLHAPAHLPSPLLWEAFHAADAEKRKSLLSQCKALPALKMTLCLCTGLKGRGAALDTLVRYYMGDRMELITYCDTTDGRTIWLFQDAEQELTPALVSRMMETVQNSYRSTTGEDFSCSIAETDETILPDTVSMLLNAPGDPPDEMGSITILDRPDMHHNSSDYTIRFVKKYIAEHIAEDINIPLLATVTGYNADYLSRAFRKNTGSTISSYIADARIAFIKQIICDEEVSMDEVYQKAGFSSRVYFNRFVKKATGMSPRALRMSVMADK